ncbi:MAG: hypothetical protein L0207_04685 [Chlamydiae bacterium]|nr:hypothetical protein [Chlamydiota bacterium]
MKKYPLTLIELFLTIAILMIAAGALCFKISGLIEDHRWHHSAALFHAELKKAQTLALSFEADIDCEIIKKNNGYFFRLISLEPIRFLENFSSFKQLGGVKRIVFMDKEIDKEAKFTICSNGIFDPTGIKILFFKKGEKQSILIDLSHPLMIYTRTN